MPQSQPNNISQPGGPDHSSIFQQARRLQSPLSAMVEQLCRNLSRSIMHHEYNLGKWPRNNQNLPPKPSLCSPSLPDSQKLYLTLSRSNHSPSVSPRMFTAFFSGCSLFRSFRSCHYGPGTFRKWLSLHLGLGISEAYSPVQSAQRSTLRHE